MFISKLYILLAFSVADPGPPTEDGSTPGTEIVDGVGQVLKYSVDYDDGVDVNYVNDGLDAGQLADAIQQTSGSNGRPLILILSVGSYAANGAPADGTLIEYNANGATQAQQIASHLVTFAPQGVLWTKAVAASPSSDLPTNGNIVRIHLCSVIGPHAMTAQLDPVWWNLIGSQLKPGVLAATLYTED